MTIMDMPQPRYSIALAMVVLKRCEDTSARGIRWRAKFIEAVRLSFKALVGGNYLTVLGVDLVRKKREVTKEDLRGLDRKYGTGNLR